MRYAVIGAIFSCFLISAGMFYIPPVNFSSVEGLFTFLWSALAFLVAAGFLKDSFR